MGTRKKKAKKKVFPRLYWSRCPIQRPHSSKKGRKGYVRKKKGFEDES